MRQTADHEHNNKQRKWQYKVLYATSSKRVGIRSRNINKSSFEVQKLALTGIKQYETARTTHRLIDKNVVKQRDADQKRTHFTKTHRYFHTHTHIHAQFCLHIRFLAWFPVGSVRFASGFVVLFGICCRPRH